MMRNEALQNPRVIVIQKLYGYYFNKETQIIFPKHRYKKFIKDVVNGTIERRELIKDLINNELKEDLNSNKTDLLIKLMIEAAIFEFMYMHKTPVKVVISEFFCGCIPKKIFKCHIRQSIKTWQSKKCVKRLLLRFILFFGILRFFK